MESYLGGVNEVGFGKDTQLQDAVIRRLAIIGEAVKHLPQEFKEAHADIPWKEMTGMRDVLIHEYSGINMKRVWDTVKKDLATLKDVLR